MKTPKKSDKKTSPTKPADAKKNIPKSVDTKAKSRFTDDDDDDFDEPLDEIGGLDDYNIDDDDDDY